MTPTLPRILAALALAPLLGCATAPPPAPEELVERTRLDVQLRQMCDGLVAALDQAAEAGVTRQRIHYLRIGVLPFQENGERARTRQLGRLVADELAVCLVDRHRLQLVERARQSDLIDEKLERDFYEDEQMQGALGRQIGADLLVLGNVSDGGEVFLISLRAADVRAGGIIAAQSTSLPADPLVDRSLHLFERKSKAGALFRSTVVPGWGQYYNDEPLKAAVVVGVEVILFGAALAYELSGQQAEKRYGVPLRSTVSARKDAIDAYEMRNVMLILGAAGWGANMLDAWFNGYAYSPELLRPRVGLGPTGAVLGWSF